MDIIGALTMEDDDDVTIIEDVESHSSCSTVPNKRMKLDCDDNQIAICSYYSVTDENSQNKESLLQEQVEGLKREKEQSEELKREKSLLEKKVEDLNEEILKQIEEQKELKKQIKTKNRVIEFRGQRIEDINKSLNESQEQSALKLEKQAEIIERYECEASEKEEMLKEKDTQIKNLTEDLKRVQKELEQTKEQLEVGSLYSKHLEAENRKMENPSCANTYGEVKETFKLSKDQEEMSRLRHDIQRKDVRIVKLEFEIRKIKEAKEKSKEQLLQVLNNQDVLADNYRRQIKQIEQEREKLMKKIDNLTTTLSEQNEIIHNLTEENEISTTAVSRQNHVIQNLRKESQKSKTSSTHLMDENDTSTSEMVFELEKEKESSTETGADDIALSSLQEDGSETEISSDADLETVRLISKQVYLAPPKLKAIRNVTNSAHSITVTSQATDSHPSAVAPQSAESHHSTVSPQATDSPNSTVTSQASSNSKVASSSTDSSNPMVVPRAEDPSESILASGLRHPSNSAVTSKTRNSPRSTVTSIRLMQDWLENLKRHGTSPTSKGKRQLFLKEDIATVVTSKRKSHVQWKPTGRPRGRPKRFPKDSADSCTHPGVQPLRIQIRTNKTKEHVDKLYKVAPSRQCGNDSSDTGSKGVKNLPKSLKESRAPGKNISSTQDVLKPFERRQPTRLCTEKKKMSNIELLSDEDNELPIHSNTERITKESSGEGNRPICLRTVRSKMSIYEFTSDADNDDDQRCEEIPLKVQKAIKQKRTQTIKNKLLNQQKNANEHRNARTGPKTLKSRKSSAQENCSARQLRANTRSPKEPPQEGINNTRTEIEMPNGMEFRDSSKTLPPAPTSSAGDNPIVTTSTEDTPIVTTSTISTDDNECAKESSTPGDFHLAVAGENIYVPKIMSKDYMLPVDLATINSSEVSVDKTNMPKQENVTCEAYTIGTIS